MAYGTAASIATCLTFTIIVWLFLSLRLFVRSYLQKGPFPDDGLAIAATFFYTALAILFIVEFWLGHFPNTDGECSKQCVEGIKGLFICDLLYAVGTYLMKLAFIWTLLRIVQSRGQATTLYILMITGAITTLALVIHGVCSCRPVSYLWQHMVNPDMPGSCLALWTRRVVMLVHSAWVLLADTIVGFAIPFILLRGSRLDLKTKFSVRLLLGIGSVASIATIARMVYIAKDSSAHVRTGLAISFWAILELAISIICTSAATWKPLVVRLGLLGYRNKGLGTPPPACGS
ncbi:hypothetical protein BJY01DRAFT_79843 [Aspergillus pseudoustus]|uniref:Rhodopsin domain-containing protein n=1 Tax=Aspergillus pseudoustus TaxID=1810923 RepID=A0ABR4J430_9EURO